MNNLFGLIDVRMCAFDKDLYELANFNYLPHLNHCASLEGLDCTRAIPLHHSSSSFVPKIL